MGIERNYRKDSIPFKTEFVIPAPINDSNRITALVLTFIACIAAYLATNHFQYYEPRYLERLAIDYAVPMVPWTIGVYLSEYIYFPLAFFLLSKNLTRNIYLWSLGFVQVISMLFFVFLPTAYPRHEFPVPADAAWLSVQMFDFLRKMDTPCNSFPSLHVGACFVTAFAFYHEARWKQALLIVWSIAIAASTMTTKQHYFVDIIAGLTLACISAYIFVFKAKYQPMGEPLVQLNADNQGRNRQIS